MWSPPPLLPPPVMEKKQGCYNLFFWLSMKARGRATRASVRLDLLPLTPTVDHISTISSRPFPSFFSDSLLVCLSFYPGSLHLHTSFCTMSYTFQMNKLKQLFVFPSLVISIIQATQLQEVKVKLFANSSPCHPG